MALEYEDLTVDLPEDMAEERAAKVAEGWRVHTAFSPTHYLMERGSKAAPQPPRAPASPFP